MSTTRRLTFSRLAPLAAAAAAVGTAGAAQAIPFPEVSGASDPLFHYYLDGTDELDMVGPRAEEIANQGTAGADGNLVFNPDAEGADEPPQFVSDDRDGIPYAGSGDVLKTWVQDSGSRRDQNYDFADENVSDGIFTSQSYTFSTWYKYNGFDARSQTDGLNYLVDANTGDDRLIVATGTENEEVGFHDGGWVDTGYEAPVDEWVHLAWSFDADTETANIYADGQLIGENLAYSPQDLNGVWDHGDSGGIISRLNGDRLFDYRVYNEALSGEQVGQLIPEPGSLALLGAGAGLMLIRRRK